MKHLIAHFGTRLEMSEALNIKYHTLNRILNNEPRKLIVYFPLIKKKTKLPLNEIWDLVKEEIEATPICAKTENVIELMPEIIKLSGKPFNEIVKLLKL